MSTQFVLLILALINFILATFNVPLGGINTTGLGLTFYILSLLIR